MSAQDRTRPNVSDYQSPTMRTYTADELLEILGPAQGYGGPTGGLDSPAGLAKTIGKT